MSRWMWWDAMTAMITLGSTLLCCTGLNGQEKKTFSGVENSKKAVPDVLTETAVN